MGPLNGLRCLDPPQCFQEGRTSMTFPSTPHRSIPKVLPTKSPPDAAACTFRLHSERTLTTMGADTYQTWYVPEPSSMTGTLSAPPTSAAVSQWQCDTCQKLLNVCSFQPNASAAAEDAYLKKREKKKSAGDYWPKLNLPPNWLGDRYRLCTWPWFRDLIEPFGSILSYPWQIRFFFNLL